jgi:hypothetical protein
MTQKSSRPKRNQLAFTAHARQRLTQRGLWPVLGHIAHIAHSRDVSRVLEQSNSGGPVERVEVDGLVIILSRHTRNSPRTLVTVFLSGDESGSIACARIRAISQRINRIQSA